MLPAQLELCYLLTCVTLSQVSTGCFVVKNSFDVQYNQDVMLLSKCYCLVRSFCRVMSIRTLLEADAQNAGSRNLEDPPENE